MNIERALQVMRHIEANKNRLIMELGIVTDADQYQRTSKFLQDRVLPVCNTVACYAGWTVILFCPDLVATMRIVCDRNGDRGWFEIDERAMELLDLTEAQASKLFYTYNWDADLGTRYKGATPKKRVGLLRQQLERVIRDDMAAA